MKTANDPEAVTKVALEIMRSLEKQGIVPERHEVFFDAIWTITAVFLITNVAPTYRPTLVKSIPKRVKRELMKFRNHENIKTSESYFLRCSPIYFWISGQI